METMVEGKARCKAALQKELGLPVDPSIPLLGFIGRLDYQKVGVHELLSGLVVLREGWKGAVHQP